MPELHFSILPAAQRTLWDVLGEHADFLQEHGYYLAGGTALALQLGHQRSIDFDFFSGQPGSAEATESHLAHLPGFLTRDIDRDTLHAEADGVKLSFIGAYKYPLVEETLESQGIRLAGITDIAMMKLLAVTHRATPRDYVDLAAILKSGRSLADLLDLSTRKYGGAFNTMMPLRALVTFDDLEEEMPMLLDPELASNWRDILRQAVRDASGKQ